MPAAQKGLLGLSRFQSEWIDRPPVEPTASRLGELAMRQSIGWCHSPTQATSTLLWPRYTVLSLPRLCKCFDICIMDWALMLQANSYANVICRSRR